MTSREITIAFELAIGVFALYLLVRRLARRGAHDRQTPPFYVAELPDDPLPNPDEPVTVAWFKLAEEAEMWAENLRGEGIDASVRDTTFGGKRYGGLSDWNSPHIEVRSEDARRAVEILREAEGRTFE